MHACCLSRNDLGAQDVPICRPPSVADLEIHMHRMHDQLTPDGVLRQWRDVGPYHAASASKNGLVQETRLFLQAYVETGSLADARAALVNSALPQRSRVTRRLIVRTIQSRLTRWNPPEWVLTDLVTASHHVDLGVLRTLLLLHYARQETFAYDAIQHIIVPRWHSGDLRVRRDDVQAFLDRMVAQHPEIATWSYETRTKLSGNFLTTLRDYGLLTGSAVKQIVEPIVDGRVVAHLWRLLEEEGIPTQRIGDHPDWRIWLLPKERVERLTAQQRSIESIE